MKYFFIIFLLAIAWESTGQTYNVETFTNEELKSEFVYDFAQNSIGELYVATANGLAIYDGLSFKVLNEENGLIEDFISHIFIDSKDFIWISYHNGGISRIKNREILNYDLNFVSSSILELSSGEIICLSDEGPFIYKAGEFINSDKFQQTKEIIKWSEISILRVDSDNTLHFERSDDKSSYIVQQDVEFIATDIKNDRVALISNSTLTLYQLQSGRLFNEKLKINLTNFKVGLDISAVVLNEDKVVLASHQDGLLEINFDKKFNTYSSRHLTTENGLNSSNIQTLFIDKEQNLWIGSYGKGVSYLPKNRVITYFQNANAISVNCIEYFQNKFYIGSNNGFYTVKDIEKSKPYLENKRINTFSAADGMLWIGTEENGLFYLKDEVIYPFLFQNIEQQPLTINCIKFHENALIAGTNSGLYIHYLDSNKSVLITTNDGLAHNVVESFIIDKHGRYWFDSPSSPIYSYLEGDFTYYKNIEGFESYDITDIKELEDDRIIFGTAGDGIFCYADNQFTQYTKADGLLSNYIYFIEENEGYSFYCGHKGGITVQLKNDSTVEFWRTSNLNELEYINPKASKIVSDGNLWIGTSQGLVNLPRVLDYNTFVKPKLFFPSIIINDSIYNTDQRIELSYGNYHIEFEFKAISLANSNTVQYEFKLEGFDKDWTTLPHTKEYAIYQTLKDGVYNFRVRLLVNGNIVGDEKSVNVIINLPFWRKTSFFVLLGAGIIILFLLIIRIITLRNKRVKKILVKKVKARTEEITLKNEKIRQINVNLEQLSGEYLSAKNLAENKTEELEKSIQYAKYIQKATFRKSEYAEWLRRMNSYFLIFKPKDIVSGDFYWGAKKGDNLYLAVGDCTGHGVPGALIGMLGVSILNDIIQLSTETNIILNKLRDRIIAELGQKNSDLNLHDGLDIAILKINLNTLVTQFSGAYNPVFIIRDKALSNAKNTLNMTEIDSRNDLVIYTTKPDRQPVGNYPEATDFSAYELQLLKNDQIYLFSDGYVDQFGGPKDKKFMKHRFYKKLLEINHLSSDEQKKNLWDTLVEWQGTNEQVDDISILGFKI